MVSAVNSLYFERLRPVTELQRAKILKKMLSLTSKTVKIVIFGLRRYSQTTRLFHNSIIDPRTVDLKSRLFSKKKSRSRAGTDLEL